MMPVPTSADVLLISETLGLDIHARDAAYYAEALSESLTNYATVKAILDDQPSPNYGDRSYSFPPPEANPTNSWHVRSHLQRTASGLLAGRTIAVKDSIPVAGLPMLAGSNIFQGFIPDHDPEIITRILDAGGIINGKAHCEYLCFSGSSHTSVGGVIHNPWKHGFSAGGSSSGSAVVVANKEADMALGADQAGSIRLPASFCGIVGLKPTYGLVPYTGIPQLDASFDHVGPLAANVSDCALLLKVIAGPDGVDERQGAFVVPNYEETIDTGVKGLNIGILREAFDMPGFNPAVSRCALQAAETLRRLGAEITEVSAPLHRHGLETWATVGWIGMTDTALRTQGFSVYRNDAYPVSLMEWARDHRSAISEAPASVKLFFLIGEYVKHQTGYIGYARGLNAGRLIKKQYDALLQHVDLLLMPTTPMTATPLPDEDSTTEAELKTSHPMAGNTAPFNLSQHPALTVPCGLVDGLPVGLMLVGRHYEEATLFRAGYAFEQALRY